MGATGREGTKVIVCLFLVLFLGVADNQVLSPLLPSIRAQFNRPAQDMGWLFTGYALSAGLSVLVWGPLSAFVGSKRGLCAGLLLFAAGSLVSFSAESFQTLLAGRVITGMGGSALSLNTLFYAAEFFPYSKRGWAMGSIVSSYFAALILGVPLGAFLGSEAGWNAVFGAGCACALILAAGLARLLPVPASAAPGSSAEVAVVQQVRTYAGFFRSARTVGALASSFFASAGTMGFLAFVGIWLHDSFGISARETGMVFVASGAAALLASPLAGALSDRIGKRVQFVLSNVLMALLLLILPGLRWGVLLFVVFGGISLAAAFRQGPMEALLSEVIQGRSRASFIALKNSCSQLGIGLAALACGALFQSSGYPGVCLFCAAANLAAAAGMSLLMRGTAL
jgi:predicted MFS family arabinose efflux permease